MPYRNMVDVLPATTLGEARVEHFEVSESDAKLHNMRCAFQPGARFDTIEPGRYARLYVGGSLMMSDTQMERYTNQDAVRMATGRVLIAGLGLGLAIT